MSDCRVLIRFPWCRMTQDKIQWLTDPAAELQKQSPGTLIVMENKDRVLFLARILEKTDDVLKFQLLPGFNVKTFDGMMVKKAKFALV